MFIIGSYHSLILTTEDDGLTIEQGIKTQRLKLLRMIAGLLSVVVFVSLVPFSCECRRWVRGMVFSVLSRAECAAQNLVIAQAAVIARQCGLRVDFERVLRGATSQSPEGLVSEMDVPSLRALRLRLVALRAVLLNLPRCAKRLLRRAMRGRSGKTSTPPPPAIDALMLCDWCLEGGRIDRPPDKACWVPEAGI